MEDSNSIDLTSRQSDDEEEGAESEDSYLAWEVNKYLDWRNVQ